MVVGDNEVALSLEVDPAGQRAQVRRAALASTIGTTIEWYDFFLYNTAAALVFPHLFFPASSAVRGRDGRRSRPTRSGSPPARSVPRSSGTGATGSVARPP